MPLIQSASKEAAGGNISKLQNEGRPHEQSVAIALNVARKNGAKIGMKKPKGRIGVKK